MSDTTTHLLLPYLLAAQAQKHVTHNEALRLLDALVQLSVKDRDRTSPPSAPSDGERYLVASGATGDWAGWDLNIACYVDGAWMKLVPRAGWRMWIEDEAVLLVFNGATWVGTLSSKGTFSELAVAAGVLSVSSLSCDWGAFSLTGTTSGKDIRPGQSYTMRSSRADAGNAFHHMFYDASGGVAGSIRTNGAGSTTFNTTSDERLKTDRQDFDPGPILEAIPVHDYTLFGQRRRGFSSAQAMQAVFPEAVTPGHGDPGDADFVPWSIDPSAVVPLLVLEVQKLRARLAVLEQDGAV